MSRGLRNIERLLKIQDQTQDILDFRHKEQKLRLCDLMENMIGFLSELQEEQPGRADVFRLLSEKIESVFESDEIKPEEIGIDTLIDEVWQKACGSMDPRKLEMIRQVAPGLSVTMDKGVLRKVCGGILRNAIENTPDEGLILIRVYEKKDGVTIQFHDFGLGITETNRRLVFGGFFHYPGHRRLLEQKTVSIQRRRDRVRFAENQDLFGTPRLLHQFSNVPVHIHSRRHGHLSRQNLRLRVRRGQKRVPEIRRDHIFTIFSRYADTVSG